MINKLFTKKRILIFVLFLYAIITSIVTTMDGGDFDVYLDAARKMSQNENIYAPPYKTMPFFYSNFFAFILIPFSHTIFLTELIWSLVSYLFLYRTFRLLEGYFDFTFLSLKEYKIWLILTVFLSIQFILYNVGMIQITFFLLWTIFESFHQLNKDKNTLAGIILGLSINIKIMPILMLPYLFYRGYFKSLFITIFTFIILLFIPAIFIGFEYNNFLLSDWWKIINPTNKEHLFETGIGRHSLVALLPVYLTETIGEMNFKRNILNLNHNIVEIIINIVRLFFLVISIFFLRTFPFKKQDNKLNSIWEISYFILLIPLLLPHQGKYAFILAIPMLSYLVYFFINTYQIIKTTNYKIAFIFFIICCAFYSPFYGSDIIGNFLFRVTQHYRILTIATILIIPISLYCNPNRLQTIIQTNSQK